MTEHKDYHEFQGLVSLTSATVYLQSFTGAVSAIGQAVLTPFGWSISNIAEGAEDRSVSGTDSSAASIAISLATLVRDLGKLGIIKTTG